MEQLNLSHYVPIILTILCLFFIILLSLEKKKTKRLTKQLTGATTALGASQKSLAELYEKTREIEEFHDSLKVAELTTKLQKTRLEAQSNETHYSTPGKYGNIQALTQKGMSVEEIALALAISSHEAQQLVNLSKLAQRNAIDNVRVDI